MSGLGIAALTMAVVWLAVLSFALILLVRQLGIVTNWAQQVTERRDDGLEIGEGVSKRALEVLPEMGDKLTYVVFLDGQCQPCREFALEAGRSAEIAALEGKITMSAVVTGTGAQAKELERLLPDWVHAARGSDADAVKKDFKVIQTPAVYEVEKGNVTGRAVAGYGLINFLNLVDARATSDAAEYAGETSPDLEVVGKQLDYQREAENGQQQRTRTY